jgi:signal transduction histidine kinase
VRIEDSVGPVDDRPTDRPDDQHSGQHSDQHSDRHDGERGDNGNRGIRDGHGRAVLRGLALFALGPVRVVLLAVHLAVMLTGVVGAAVFFQQFALLGRRHANQARRLAGAWSGTLIPVPYQPKPPAPLPGPDGLYRSKDGRHFYTTPTWLILERRIPWVWGDVATWRDLLWLLLDPLVGGALTVLPAALIGYGVSGSIPVLPWHRFTGPGPVGVILGVPCIVVGFLIAPRMLRLHDAWTKLLLGPTSATGLVWWHGRQRWLCSSMRAVADCLVFGLASLPALPFFLVGLCSMLVGPRAAANALCETRWLPNVFRQLAHDRCGLDLPRPYRPRDSTAGGRAVLRDPATWRDLAWLGCQSVVGVVLLPLLLPGGLMLYGVWGMILPALEALCGAKAVDWYGELFGSIPAGIVGGFAMVVAGPVIAPTLVRLHNRWLPVLLRPTANAELRLEKEQLTARVDELTESRTDATDTQAAEVRRIERDLHDGAQARLVAMGMTLGAVEALIDRDPEAAKRLVAQARDNSATALSELRGLVRGIHPPVLAERGLVDAIRALALDSPLDVQVAAIFDGHAEAPVESAVYFAVAELLTNAVRHSGAARVWIDLRHVDSVLRVTVVDDGEGGADPERGSGLRGIERRLGTFDGRVAVSSPPGGPTMVTMELPCALSSRRTSTSSGTA